MPVNLKTTLFLFTVVTKQLLLTCSHVPSLLYVVFNELTTEEDIDFHLWICPY